jgi:hypothetical protein
MKVSVMASVTRIPPLADLVEDFLDKPYAGEERCVLLIRDLFVAGGLVPADATPANILPRLREVWFTTDAADPLTLVAPWDLYMCRKSHEWVRHFGLVVDTQRFVHVAQAGVRLEPLLRWRPYLVQVARLDTLL